MISTRTTAREVQQKLEHFGVDQEKAVILDTLSVERGYSRRRSDNIHYVSAPDDLDGIVAQTETFFEKTSGKRRLSVDQGDGPKGRTRLLALIEEHDAVGLFHFSPEVHSDDVLAAYEALFDGVIELAEDGDVTARF